MEVLHDNVKTVSGVYFQITDTMNLDNESEKVLYVLYLKHDAGNDYSILHKFIRMFAIPYRIVLIDDGERECIGFILFGDKEEQEELDSLMEWIDISHPEWVVVNCQEDDMPNIIGFRMANNMFHARKLALYGEVLD